MALPGPSHQVCPSVATSTTTPRHTIPHHSPSQANQAWPLVLAHRGATHHVVALRPASQPFALAHGGRRTRARTDVLLEERTRWSRLSRQGSGLRGWCAPAVPSPEPAVCGIELGACISAI